MREHVELTRTRNPATGTHSASVEPVPPQPTSTGDVAGSVPQPTLPNPSPSCTPDVPSDRQQPASLDDLQRAAMRDQRKQQETAAAAGDHEVPVTPAAGDGDAAQNAKPADATRSNTEPVDDGASLSLGRAARADMADRTPAVRLQCSHDAPGMNVSGPWVLARERADAGSTQRQQQMRPNAQATPPPTRLPRLRDPRSVDSPTPVHSRPAAVELPYSGAVPARDGAHTGGQAAPAATHGKASRQAAAVAYSDEAVRAAHHVAPSLKMPTLRAHLAQSKSEMPGVEALRSDPLAAMMARGRGASAIPVPEPLNAGKPAPDPRNLTASCAAWRIASGEPPLVRATVIQATAQPPGTADAGPMTAAANAQPAAGAQPPPAASPMQRGQTVRDVVLAVRSCRRNRARA